MWTDAEIKISRYHAAMATLISHIPHYMGADKSGTSCCHGNTGIPFPLLYMGTGKHIIIWIIFKLHIFQVLLQLRDIISSAWIA